MISACVWFLKVHNSIRREYGNRGIFLSVNPGVFFIPSVFVPTDDFEAIQPAAGVRINGFHYRDDTASVTPVLFEGIKALFR